jgi:flagellar basal body-associated protein FliL
MILVVIVVLMLAGGGLTAQLLSNSGSLDLPVLTQTVQPDASPTTMLPWKAEQFFLLIGFILFNVVGIAATLAIIFWFIDRGIRRGKAEAAAADKAVAASEQAS